MAYGASPDYTFHVIVWLARLHKSGCVFNICWKIAILTLKHCDDFRPSVKCTPVVIECVRACLSAGFIPPPLIFGAGIDSTCLFWSTECESRGACLLYDNVSYRRLYVSMAIVLKVIAFLLYTTTWQCLRYNYHKYIKNSDGYPSPTDMFNNANDGLCKDGPGAGPGSRTKFIYSLEDNEYCDNMESVL